jgi:hypothetical protein
MTCLHTDVGTGKIAFNGLTKLKCRPYALARDD